MSTFTRDELIEKLGIQSLGAEMQQALLEDVANAVSTKMMVRISETLSDEDLDKLSDLIDNGEDDKVEEFIKSKHDNYDEFAHQVEDEVIEELARNQRMLGDEIQRVEQQDSALQSGQ